MMHKYFGHGFVSFTLLILALFTILSGGILNRQREIDIVLSLKGGQVSNLEVFLFDRNKAPIRNYQLSSRNSVSTCADQECQVSVWIDPTYVHSVSFKSDSSNFLEDLNSVSLKNILGTSHLDFIKNQDMGSVEVELPKYLKDPLIYVDYCYIFTVLVTIFYCIARRSERVYVYLSLALRSRKAEVKMALLSTLTFVVVLILSGQKTFTPFSIQIKGHDLPASHFKFYFDTGAGFNEIEKTYAFISNQKSIFDNVEHTLEIANTSTEVDRSEVFINQILIDGLSIPIQPISSDPEVRMVNGNLFIPAQKKISFHQPFTTLALDVLRHSHSGNLSVILDGQTVAKEDLYSKEQTLGNRIQFDRLLGSSSYSENRVIQATFNHNFQDTRLKNLRLDSRDAALLQQIEEVTFVSPRGPSSTILERGENGIVIKPTDTNFNLSYAAPTKFKILSLTLMLIVFYYVSFQTFVFIRSDWFAEHVQLRVLVPLFLMLFAFFYSVLLSSWPGIFTGDSFLWIGLLETLISNYKPIIYSVYLGMLSCLSTSPACPQVFQIAIFSLVVSFLLSVCIKSRVKAVWYVATVLILLISPTLPLYLIVLWKDVPFSIGIMSIGLILYIMSAFDLSLSQKRYLTFFVLLPLVILTAGMKHSGCLLPFTIVFVLLVFKLLPKRSIFVFFYSTIILSAFCVSVISFILDSKPRTDFKRLELFPYIVYASYVPWKEYLADLSPEESEVVVRNVSFIGKVEDQIGVELMFSGEKVNLQASYEQIKSYKKEVRKAVFSYPYAFLKRLILANYMLLNGDGYVWDKGFLPLNYSHGYAREEYLNSDYFLLKQFPGSALGAYVRDFYSHLLSSKNGSYLASLCVSYFPQIVIFLSSILFCLKNKGVLMFSSLMLMLYAGVFLMPASMEFRYAFHFVPACLILPLLIGLERARV